MISSGHRAGVFILIVLSRSIRSESSPSGRPGHLLALESSARESHAGDEEPRGGWRGDGGEGLEEGVRRGPRLSLALQLEPRRIEVGGDEHEVVRGVLGDVEQRDAEPGGEADGARDDELAGVVLVGVAVPLVVCGRRARDHGGATGRCDRPRA